MVPGYISEGFLVLAGRQKLGKTRNRGQHRFSVH
jgi:hypothetical protein